MNEEERISGVVKIGVFVGGYMSGVPNSKIYTLSRHLYKNMDDQAKELLEDTSSTFDPLSKEELRRLHGALVSKDYALAASLLSGKLKPPL
jgi:hypothetical protein